MSIFSRADIVMFKESLIVELNNTQVIINKGDLGLLYEEDLENRRSIYCPKLMLITLSGHEIEFNRCEEHVFYVCKAERIYVNCSQSQHRVLKELGYFEQIINNLNKENFVFIPKSD